MRHDPFLLDLPAAVAFSGGRTSAYMTDRITKAHRKAGVPLPWYIFCNTGKERPETLDFVQECSRRWDIPVVWLEYRWEPGRHYFEQVTYSEASRDGRPFLDAIRSRSLLPNRVARYCTAELKVKTMWRWAVSIGLPEHGSYQKAIGLRADEPARVDRMRNRRSEYTLKLEQLELFGSVEEIKASVRKAHETRATEEIVLPLDEAGVTLAEVTAFWKSQPFDLQLQPWEGNCDLCFLKRRGALLEILRSRPDLAQWWVEQEQGGKLFRSLLDRPRYSLLLAESQQPGLFPEDEDDLPCACTD